MIDSHGFRHNVGIILSNEEGKLLWARRIGQNAWQFPQGGIMERETPLQAMYRELEEELGLEADHVNVMGQTRSWLHYRLPQRFIRTDRKPVCIGQKQVWFLLRMVADESHFQLDRSVKPEFDGWRWVSYWYPVKTVVWFKRKVYQRALAEFAPLLAADRDNGGVAQVQHVGSDASQKA
ncbi:MAG: RNA pyrophosphohydrolase [Gammaproteobacteria bacterium]|nr:RNA pyrophosphohydrolase [Gammaproteobacteria bacterium]